MKKVLFFFVMSLAFVSCRNFSDKGELVGAESSGGQSWFAERPFGMVLVPGGSFTMGKTQENRWGGFEALPKGVTVKEFFMDETEISNSEYKEFVYWVRDSIVRTQLAEYAETLSDGDGDGDGDAKGESIQSYSFLNSDLDEESEDATPYQKYMLKTYGFIKQNHKGTQPLNWDVDLSWNTIDYPDEEYAEVMDDLYLPPSIVGNNKIFDVSVLNYSYISQNKADRGTDKNIVNVDINVYPDTTVWVRDFAYSQNDVMVDNYFWHAAYNEYPVVGVSWTKAKAFCNWRTKKKNDYLKSIESGFTSPGFRLPTEAEWEYAARGGIENGIYPWGGPYVTDRHGEYLANFRAKRNNLAADGFTYTVEAHSFIPNDYGLYNMAGNVSEWTSTAYNTSAFHVTSSLNSDVQEPLNKRKIIRGGSWKDVAYFLEVSTKDYEYADSAKSYIGFRTVQDYLGNAENKKSKY